jgi:hypothetical protein
MKFIAALPVLAALALTAPALAQQEAPPPDRAAMMAKHHSEMCTNHYAHAVGEMAEIEVRFALTPAQKAPFERWKEIKLRHAKAQSAKCADFAPLGRDASIIDRRERQIAQLQTRLDNLKAEEPALVALVKVLTPQQQEVLKRAAHEAMGDRMMMMHRFEDGRGGPMAPHRMEMRDQAPVK